MSGLGPFDGIPIIVDRNMPSVCLVDMGMSWSNAISGMFDALPAPPHVPKPMLIGSVNAWGEWMAVHLAAAYRPEGVP